MKYIILFLLISYNCLSQETTVKVPPSKDTTVVTFKTVTTTSSNTVASYTTVSIPVKVDTVVTPPPVNSMYEGFGKTKGGEGKPAVTVTSASQLSSAIKSNSYIIVDNKTGAQWVFRGNYTNLVNVTIDASGSTYPVVLNGNNNGGTLIFEGNGCHDIIVKSIAVRNAGDDCIAMNKSVNGSYPYKIIIDHCSASGGRDGSIDITNSHDITVQWCLIGNSTNGGSLVDYPGTKNVSIHHNLYVNSFERNPLIGSQENANKTDLVCDFTNNIVYQWSSYGTDINNNGTANVRNNYYYSTSNPDRAVLTAANSYGSYPRGFAYVSGNFSGNGVNIDKQSNNPFWPIPADAEITMQSACDAAKLVLAGVGPVKKDQVDLDLIKKVSLIGCQ